jgi:hypothetical protein
MPRTAATPKGVVPPRERKKGERSFTKATMSRDVRLMALTSLNFLGGVKYLVAIAKKNPSAYLQFVSKCLIKEDGAELGGATFVIQQINVNPQQVAGVLTSPVQEHVSPVRLITKGGEVIDVETRNG